jgi:glycosyltransferase involved in cell wall biosynthesis
VQRLLSAYSKLKSPSIDLVIVGSAMWNQRPFNLNEEQKSHVHFLGYLEKSELVNVMASALALTYVPYFEGFGIPMVEAMRCGTPVLCSNNTCLPEVAGDAAIYCDPFNEDDIFVGLQRLLNEPDLPEKLSQKGLERSKKFSWDNAALEAWVKLMATANT